MMLSSAQASEFTVHHAPGGPSDKATRVLHKYLPKDDYIIVNRPGAQGKIAVKHLMSHDSLMLATMAQIYVSNSMTGSEYNPNSDLTVLANIGAMPSVLVCRNDLGIKGIPDIIKRDKLSFAVAGTGSSEHLATMVFFNKINKQHLIVPYSAGGSKSVMDMLGGHVDCMFSNYPTVKEWVSDPRLKVLMTSHELNLNVDTWEKLYNEKFPFQASLAIVVASNNKNHKIVKDVKELAKNSKVKEDLINIGIFPVLGTSDKAIKEVLDNNNKIKQVIVNNNITLK